MPQTTPGIEKPPVFRGEHWLILLFSVYAVLRVFVFAAAFPFFSNIDEAAQFDLVVKYSHFEFRRSLNRISPESAAHLAIFGSPEYSTAEPSTPIWTRPAASSSQRLKAREKWWRQHLNYESLEPPLYYFLAGAWLNLGRAAGLEGGPALYWIRFLNVGLAGGLVWLAFAAVRIIFPERLFFRLGVPFLVAIWPQDAFYSTQSDALSPVCFGCALIALLHLLSTDHPHRWVSFWAGLGLAATFLTKLNNFGAVAVGLGAVAIRAALWWREGQLRSRLSPILIFFASATLPIALWCFRNDQLVGDLTASSAKMQFLTWQLKPVGAWWNHPIFTPAGAWTFWSDLLAHFWRGEIIWHGQRFSFRFIDLIYVISSTVFIGSAGWMTWRGRADLNNFQRKSLLLAFAAVVLSIFSLVVLSLIFDFGQCLFPSPTYPFFSSGRLLSAVVIPFMLLYLYGLECILGWIRAGRARYFVLGGFGLLVAGSELLLSIPVFASRYNFFHMW